MPRKARLFIPNQTQWITLNALPDVTLCKDNVDYERLLSLISQSTQTFGVHWYAWMVLPQSLCLMVRAEESSALSKAMQSLSRQYVHYYHHRYGRAGTLWRGRFKNALIQETYVHTALAAMSYMPVLSQVSSDYLDYEYSALPMYLNLKVTQTEWVVLSVIKHEQVYDASCSPELNADRLLHVLSAISTSQLSDIAKKASNGWALGDESYLAWVASETGQAVTPKPKGGDRRSDAYRTAVSASAHGRVDSDEGGIKRPEQPAIDADSETASVRLALSASSSSSSSISSRSLMSAQLTPKQQAQRTVRLRQAVNQLDLNQLDSSIALVSNSGIRQAQPTEKIKQSQQSKQASENQPKQAELF